MFEISNIWSGKWLINRALDIDHTGGAESGPGLSVRGYGGVGGGRGGQGPAGEEGGVGGAPC